jgi:hypothetical protein
MKFIRTTIALLLLSTSSAFCQTSCYFNYPGFGEFLKVIGTKDNGYAAIGQLGTVGIVMKFNASMQLQWAKKIASNGTNVQTVPRNLVEANNGCLFVQLWGSKNSKTTANFIKFSPTGNLLLSKTVYSNSGNLVNSTAMAASITGNGFVVGGGNCVGSNYLIKCDSNINIVWANRYSISGSSTVSTVHDIILDNGAYTCASNASTTGGSTDVFVMKVDDAGIVQAQKQIKNAQGNESLQQSAKLSNNGYAICCYISTSNQDNFYYYLDSNWGSVNCKQYSVANDHHFYIVPAAANNNIIVGSTYTGTNSTDKHNFYFSVNNAGTVVWSKKSDGQLLTNYYDQLWCATKRHDNNGILAMGTSYGDKATGVHMDLTGAGFCNSTDLTLTTTTPYTVTLANPLITVNTFNLLVDTVASQVSDTTYAMNINCGGFEIPSAIQNNEHNSNINIYPNPASTLIHCDIDNTTMVKATAINATGIVVPLLIANGAGKGINFNIEQLASGCYTLLIYTNTKRFTGKFIKQ